MADMTGFPPIREDDDVTYLENRIKNLKAQRDDAVAVLRDLAWEGKIDGLSVDGVARLDDPTGVLGRAQAVLQEFPEAKAH